MLRFLTIVVLALNTAAAGGLVSRWQGEGNALDSVGPNNGNVVSTIQYTPGVIGQAFRFPDSGYINVPNPAAGGLVSPSSFTFAAWVRFEGADSPPEGGPGAIVSYGSPPSPGNSNGFMIMQSGRNGDASPLAFLIGINGAPGFTVLQSPLADWNFGQFYHLAATFDAATHTMAIYRNGQLQAARSDVPGTTMSTDPAAAFYLGKTILPDATLDGMLDDVRFYNHALSAAEVQALVPEPTGAAAFGFILLALLNRRNRTSL